MIVACPACDSRYDATGKAAGAEVRCRCGNVFALAAPSPQARLLACPHCGAGVAPAATACEHCASELLLKACPRCLQRVFHGHKHCPECGAELGLAAAGQPRGDLPCPRCDVPLHARLVGDVVIDECTKCQGLFLDRVAIQRVIGDRVSARAETLLGEIPRAEIRVAPRPGEKMYVKCPSCRNVMNRRQFASGAGIVVDVCRSHGTFFDAGELPAIIDFVMNGGLVKAARKDLERQREQIARERDQVQTFARDSARFAVQRDAFDRGTAMIDLLMSLFG